MTPGIGLSIGATNCAAVIPGFAAVTRRPVLTLSPHRPPEVGVPYENSRLDGRGLVVTGFVDRVADPVGIMATDGTFHRGEVLIAGALRALTYTATGGRTPITPPGVVYPAHWRPAAVAALRRELSVLPEWSARSDLLTLSTDAAAALAALHAGPGLPTRGVVALCDFGGSGTTIALADAADGYRPIGTPVRHTDFSGEFIDRALLAHVLSDLRMAATADQTGTSAIGALHQLRTECRDAKERLSHSSVTVLSAVVPGHHCEVRLTRAELDDEIRDALMSVIEALREHLLRNRIHPADLSAVATIGGGANIPAVTTALSAHLRVPVITVARPELTAATGAALLAVRRREDDSKTAVAQPALLSRTHSTTQAATQSTRMPAIAWSEVDNVPEIALLVADSGAAAGISSARPALDFVPEAGSDLRRPKADAWYRPILVTAGVFAAMVLVGTGAVMALRNDASAMAGATAPAPGVQPAPAAPAAGAPSEPAATPEQDRGAPSYIQAAPAPKTLVVVSTPPPVAMQAPAPAAPPPPVDNPPPPSAPPSTPTTTPPQPPSEPPPSSPPSSPPVSEPPRPPSEPPPSSPPSSDPPPAHEEPPGEQSAEPEQPT